MSEIYEVYVWDASFEHVIESYLFNDMFEARDFADNIDVGERQGHVGLCLTK